MTDEVTVLNSVKKLLGIDSDYHIFDDEITIHINSVFSVLHQIGASPLDGFMLLDGTETWSQFIGDAKHVQMVKTYTYLRVRLIFDPPATSFVMDALKKQADELEWRLSIMELQWNPGAYGPTPSNPELVGLYVVDDNVPSPYDIPDGSLGFDPITGNIWEDV